MRLTVDPGDRTPLYAQLEQGIRLAVATGELRAGDQLPTVRQLAVDLRINANTVARVYLALEREGVLLTKRGVGTFLADAVPRSAHAGQRERKLSALVDRFVMETSALGYSIREVVQRIEGRSKREES